MPHKFLRTVSRAGIISSLIIGSTHAAYADTPSSHLISQTFVSELGADCSLEPPNLEIDTSGQTSQELIGGVGAKVLAPILANVISGGIDLIGNAITNAASEDKTGKTAVTSPGSGNLAEIDWKLDSPFSPELKTKHFCVRTLVAKVGSSSIDQPVQPPPLMDDSDTHDPDAVEVEQEEPVVQNRGADRWVAPRLGDARCNSSSCWRWPC